VSTYHEQKTAYKDAECLVKALGDQGYTNVEVHEHAAQLFDFQGRPTHYVMSGGDLANIIIRRQYVPGASNDIGFTRQSDGTYSALISQYDSHRHGAEWMTALRMSYTEHADMKLAKKNGLRLLSRKIVEVAGKKRVQLQFLDPRGV
jgi:uncharacterized protein DUF1257